MKINKSYLQQIIKEELQNIMNEESRFKIDNDQDRAKALGRLSSLRRKTFSGWFSGSREKKEKANNELIRAISQGVVKYDNRKAAAEQAAAEEEDLTTQAVYDQEQREKALGPNASIDPGAAAKERDQEEYLQQDMEKGSKWLSGVAKTAKDAFGNFMKGDEQPAKKRRTKAQRQAILSKRIGRSVANIQNRIRKYYRDGSKTFASGKADGKYGRPGGETERAIKLFQKYKLNIAKPDGLWGKDTEKGYKKLAGKEKSWLMTSTLYKIPQKGTPQKAAVQSVTAKQPSEIERLKAEFDAATKNVIDAYRGDIGKQNNPDWKKDYNILVSRAKAAGKAYAAAKGADHDKRMAALAVKRQMAAAKRKGLEKIKIASQRTRKK